MLSVFKGLLSPSGSGLVGFELRTGQGYVASGRVFSSILAAIPSLSVLLFIQTYEFQLSLPAVLSFLRQNVGGNLVDSLLNGQEILR